MRYISNKEFYNFQIVGLRKIQTLWTCWAIGFAIFILCFLGHCPPEEYRKKSLACSFLEWNQSFTIEHDIYSWFQKKKLIKLRKFPFIPNLPRVNYTWLLIFTLFILQLTKKWSLILSLQNIQRNVLTHDPTQVWTMLFGKMERYGSYSHLRHLSCNDEAVSLSTWKMESFLFRHSHLFIFQLCNFSTFLCAQASYYPVSVSIFVKKYTRSSIIWIQMLALPLCSYVIRQVLNFSEFQFSLLQNRDINAPASGTVPGM